MSQELKTDEPIDGEGSNQIIINEAPIQYDAGTTVEMSPEGTTKRVHLDLEIDTTTKDLGPNPFVKWVHLAKTIDSWRIFPRIFITVYIILLYQVVNWFMSLSDPNMEQSGLVSIVVGAGAAWFGLYVGSSRNRGRPTD